MGLVLGKGLGALADGISLADVSVIHAGEADPVIRAQLLGDTCRQKCLMQGRLGLDQQNVRACLVQDLHPAAVEFIQHGIIYAVMPAVLRAVCQIGAVRADAGQAQGPCTSRLLTFLFPPLFPCFSKDLDRARDQPLGLFPCRSVCHQPRNRRLVAAGDPAVRACPEVVQMDLLDQLRRFLQRLCRPQFRIQVCTQMLKGGGHGSVDDHDFVFFDDLCNRVVFVFHMHSPLFLI